MGTTLLLFLLPGHSVPTGGGADAAGRQPRWHLLRYRRHRCLCRSQSAESELHMMARSSCLRSCISFDA